MRYQEALIAWTPGTDQIRVGPLMQGNHDPDWTDAPIRYECTGGAVETWLRECQDKGKRDLALFIEFHTITVGDKVPVEAAHTAFLAIDEYRALMSPDIPGADRNSGYPPGW